MKTTQSPNIASPLSSVVASRGVRLTRQRRLLLELIEGAEGHVQPSELLRQAQERDPGIDRATVYRTLNLLKSIGLIDELDLLHLEGHEHYYELKSRTGHAHVGCLRCGKILEFESDAQSRLSRDIERATGWKVGSARIEVAAVCPECQAKDTDTPNSGHQALAVRRKDTG